jgi:hypothetical protein
VASQGACRPTESDDADIGGQMDIPTFAPAALGSVETVLADLHIAFASERPECGEVGGPAVDLVVLPCREREIKRLSKMPPVNVIEVYVRARWPVPVDGADTSALQPGKPRTPLEVARSQGRDGGTKPQRRSAWYRRSPFASWEATAGVQHPARVGLATPPRPSDWSCPQGLASPRTEAVRCLAGVLALGSSPHMRTSLRGRVMSFRRRQQC